MSQLPIFRGIKPELIFLQKDQRNSTTKKGDLIKKHSCKTNTIFATLIT